MSTQTLLEEVADYWAEAAVTIEETVESNRDSTFIIYENINEKFDQMEKSIKESEKYFSFVKSIAEMEESSPLIEEKCDYIMESIQNAGYVEYDPLHEYLKENIKDAAKGESQEVIKNTLENKIEVIETSYSDINEDVLAISADQTDEIEFKAVLREEELKEDRDIMAEKSSANISTEDTEGAISICTLVLSAYVVYCTLQLILFSLSA